MNLRIISLLLLALILSACRASLPRQTEGSADERTTSAEKHPQSNDDNIRETPPATGGGSYLAGDGPGANVPANLQQIPDAVPHAEPLHRYANRPYSVMGKNYKPLTATGSYKERGVASWYGKKFHGEKTSIGEIYDMYAMSAAHTTLPIPSYARVTNLANHKSVIVRVNDRGPFLHERIIDLSYTAASKIGIIGSGQGMVEVESLSADGNPSTPIYQEPVQVSALADDTPVPTADKIYLQLGAFNSQRGAEAFLDSMREKLKDTGKALSMAHHHGMVKVRIGPYASADTARTTALKLESRLGFKPMLSLP